MAVAVTRNLVTLEEMRAYCLHDPTDDSFDYLWNMLIPSVSEAACLWVDRQFWAEDQATHTFDAAGWCGQVSLAPWELRTVESMLLDGAEADWTLLPVGRTAQGTYLSVQVGSTGGAELEVAGDWGMADVPPTVKQACRVSIDAIYQNTAGHASESLGSHSFSAVVEAFPLGGLTRESRGALEPFRRIAVT